MTKRQRTIAEEDFPVFTNPSWKPSPAPYNSITAGQKDYTCKVKEPNTPGGKYVIQRAPNPATAAMRVREAFPGCNVLVIDSRDAVLSRDSKYK
jgi:hypothetical protein